MSDNLANEQIQPEDNNNITRFTPNYNHNLTTDNLTVANLVVK